jgi:flagellar motor switch protein FliN/FliY
MMMGDGSAAYVDDHKDAISELFSQVLGSFSVTLSAKLGMSVGGGQVEVQEFGFTNAPISLDAYDMAVLSMKVPSLADSSIIALISSDLGDELAAKMGDAAGEAGEPPAMTDGVGLSNAELDDLAKVSQPGGGEMTGGDGFSETSVERISSKATNENIEALLDVDLDVSIELGKASLSIKKVLELAPGSIVELDKMAGEPVDLLVNNKVVAKGEVVVVDENFGIRIVSLVSTEERIRSLR